MHLTPEFLFDLESNMRIITSREYDRLLSKLWWEKVARRMPSQSKKERITWLLDTAKIERPNAKHGGGQAIFEDIVAKSTEFENENAVAGLEVKKEQLEDLDGNGVQLATNWSRQIGAYAAYWPQKEVANAIKANPTTYDGLTFFHGSHPVNPFNTGAGTFANVFTGVASGAYPGALPIDDSVTVEVALQNLAKAVGYISSIKMPNGEDPRQLRAAGILGPSRLMPRLTQLLNAKQIVQSAASGALVGDVEAVISCLGLGQPIEAPELGAAFGGSDTTYYILAEEITTNELGAFAYVDREPFSVLYHGPMTDAELARKRVFQWTTEGRNTVGAGHPYLLFQGKAA